MEKIEKTIVLIKPDGLQRGLVGEITRRFEMKGLKLVGIKMMHLDDPLLIEHYAHVAEKPFFPRLKDFMKSSPVVAQCWEGFEAAGAVRTVAGVTNSRKADGGTIRGDLAMGLTNNVIHCSDSSENAEIEVKRFFKDEELFEYHKSEWLHVYNLEELGEV
ncbi:MAG: nucleoside-diphosphate kinase [Patescibacteria group bacterium]